MRGWLLTSVNWAMWKSSARGKKKPSTNCKSSLRGPLSLGYYDSVSFFLLHAGPWPGSLGKCQAVDWQRMKGCGRRSGGRRLGVEGGGRGVLRQRRKNSVLEVFRHRICLTFLPILNKFSHSSWNRAPPFWQVRALCSGVYTKPCCQAESVWVNTQNTLTTLNEKISWNSEKSSKTPFFS